MTTALGSYTVKRVISLKPVNDITDRAKRYRAQNAVKGPKKCVVCGAGGKLDVMHLSGDESDGEPKNLGYGCRRCNAALAAGFKRIGRLKVFAAFVGVDEILTSGTSLGAGWIARTRASGDSLSSTPARIETSPRCSVLPARSRAC